jgi:hypothetical protein
VTLGSGLTYFAKQLRKNQTESEKKLWKCLKSRQIGSLKFRRQQPIGPYIVDYGNNQRSLIEPPSPLPSREGNNIKKAPWLQEAF